MEELKVIGWTNYDSECETLNIESREHNDEVMKAIAKDILDNGYSFSGEEHQNPTLNTVPVLNNGKCVRFSYRAWGYLMAATINNNEDYMAFYMADITKESKYPNSSIDPSKFNITKEAAFPIVTREDTEIMKTCIYDGMDFKTLDKALNEVYKILKEKIDNQFD